MNIKLGRIVKSMAVATSIIVFFQIIVVAHESSGKMKVMNNMLDHHFVAFKLPPGPR
jgi:hypothetical protein